MAEARADRGAAVPPPTLVFVYNARAGIAAGLLDSIHKAVSPSTYPCSLCAVTHGALRMNPRWRAYLAMLPMPVAFYHRPDFRAAYPACRDPLPLVALDDGGLRVLLDAGALAGIDTVDALIAALSARLGATAGEAAARAV